MIDNCRIFSGNPPGRRVGFGDAKHDGMRTSLWRADPELIEGDILQNSKPLTNLTVYSDVKHPDDSFEPRLPMMRMGKWYMTHYNLNHEPGRHFITIAFDKAGKHYVSSIHYPE